MRLCLLILSCFILTNAFAGRETTRCSNSDGSVNWEIDDNLNKINLKYSNFIEGILTLNLDQVNIDFKKVIHIKEMTYRGCCRNIKSTVYTGLVRITGSEKNPDVLSSQFPKNKVQTEVICTTVTTKYHSCKDKCSP